MEVADVKESSGVEELKMFISIDVPLRFNKTDVKCLSKRFLTLFIFDYICMYGTGEIVRHVTTTMVASTIHHLDIQNHSYK